MSELRQCVMTCSTGASARPKMIVAAMIEPELISPFSASAAPIASIADCNRRRSAFEVEEMPPRISDA